MNVVNSGFLKIMVDAMALKNVCDKSWLMRAKLPEDWFETAANSKYIALDDFIKLGNQLPSHMDGMPIGIFLGKQSLPGSYGSIGFAASACETLSEAAHHLPRFESLVFSNARTEIEGECDPTLTWSLIAYQIPPWLEDWIMSSWVIIARWLTQEDASPLFVKFQYSKPENSDVYEDFFQCPVEFNSDGCSISLKSDLWNQSLTQHQPHLKIPLQQAMKQEMVELDQPEDKRVTCWVKDRILNKNIDGLTFLELCKFMKTSERSLRRTLTEYGTTFSDIVFEQKMQYASQELTNLDLTITQVSFNIGYSDPVAFRRAFKRWANCTPSEYRSKNTDHFSGGPLK